MPERISNQDVRREFDPRHTTSYGLITITLGAEKVIVHDTHNLKERYEAFWRLNQGAEPEHHNPVQDAYSEELTNDGNGIRMLRILQSLRENQAHADLFDKLDEITALRYKIQAARAEGQTVEIDYDERDLWSFYHSKLFDILVPETQQLDSSLDPSLFCR